MTSKNKQITVSACEMMCMESGTAHNSTTNNRHQRRKMAAILKIKNAEMQAAFNKIADLRKRKLPTVGISNVGLSQKAKRLGHLTIDRMTKNHSHNRKVLNPLYKSYQTDIGILKYLEGADRR